MSCFPPRVWADILTLYQAAMLLDSDDDSCEMRGDEVLIKILSPFREHREFFLSLRGIDPSKNKVFFAPMYKNWIIVLISKAVSSESRQLAIIVKLPSAPEKIVKEAGGKWGKKFDFPS